MWHIAAGMASLALIAGVIFKIRRAATLPMHLRWELYPVPHEPGRARYGGSILEEVNWWTKPRRVNHAGTLRAMMVEILSLKGIFEHNRALWWGSFPFHWGLYILVTGLVLNVKIILADLVGLTALTAPAMALVPVLAWLSFILGTVGGIILLGLRLTSRKMRAFNTPGHYFNLLLTLAIFISGLIWIAGDAAWPEHACDLLTALIGFRDLPPLSAAGAWHAGLMLFFMAYFPFTHMTHAFMKFFTYHHVRWEDAPNMAGGKMQSRIERLEGQPVSWSAPHVGADGRKTWTQIVGETGEQKKS